MRNEKAMPRPVRAVGASVKVRGNTNHDSVAGFDAACKLLPLAFGLPMALMLAAGVMFGWI